MTKKRQRLLAAIIVPGEMVLAGLAWRDLRHRTDEQVRGSKQLWRAFILLNPGNSLFYWLRGRR